MRQRHILLVKLLCIAAQLHVGPAGLI
jgi:hypothetical protein